MYFLRFFTCMIIISAVFEATAQKNLIRNGGFEDHGRIECLHCYHLYGRYPGVVYHWDNGDWGAWLIDKNYKFTSEEQRGNPLGKMQPYAGNTMCELWYLPTCNGIHGAAARLTAQTTEPLLVGKLYEVRMWLYIESAPKSDPDWPRHIGIALLPQKVKMIRLSATRSLPSVPLMDTVLYDRWYQVKWRVRPLCNSKYLMIGLFSNDTWPRSRSYADVRYYIDNVEMYEIPSEYTGPDSSVYYCSRYEPSSNPDLKPRLDNNLQFYFPSAEFTLSAEHRVALDSLAAFARRYPDEVFEISGHTDSIGSDNQALSENRTRAVFDYLTGVCQLPAYRLITLSMGSTQPLAPNNTEAGRQRNRRVELRQSEMPLNTMFYRQAVTAAAGGQTPEALLMLGKWLQTAPQGNAPLPLFDPRFQSLKKDKRWPAFVQKLRAPYQKLHYPAYAFTLDSLRLDDLLMLGELDQALTEATGFIPGQDSALNLPDMPPAPEARRLEACREHYAALQKIVKKTGWPKRSEFGESASEAAFYLLQHSADSAAYVQWLPVIRKSCEEGETYWMQYAMLFDRCQIIAGKPQHYGTHSNVDARGIPQRLPCDGNTSEVNARRALIGLPLLTE